MPQRRVYLDTNILSNWILLYNQDKGVRDRAGKRAKKAIALHDDVINGAYTCHFVTSKWTLAELGISVRNSVIAKKMLEDGRSLASFNKEKEDYSLNAEEELDVKIVIGDFHKHLQKMKVEIRPAYVSPSIVQSLSIRYGLDASDAFHLAVAHKGCGCHYFVTDDRDFLEAKRRIKEIKVLRPLGIRTERELLSEKPTFAKII